MEANRFYSSMSEDLRRLLTDSNDMRQHRINSANLNNDYIKNYEYSVGTWPIILSQQGTEDMGQLMVYLSTLLEKLLVHLKSTGTLASSLSISPYYNEVFRPVGIQNLILRHDILFNAGQPKFLEVNSGSTCGGWQHHLMLSEFKRAFNQFSALRHWDLQHEDIWKNIFSSVIEAVKQLDKAKSNVRILVFIKQDELGKERIQEELTALVNTICKGRFASSELCFFSDFNSVDFDRDTRLVYQQKAVDALLIPIAKGIEIKPQFLLKASQSYSKGQLIFPDGPLHTVYGNKHLFALLHDPAIDIFDEQERQFIQSYVPWTKRLVDGFGDLGIDSDLAQQIISERSRYVLKKGQSMQGRDVFVGQFTEADAWKNQLKNVIEQPDDWLLQDYYPADQELMCWPPGNLNNYKLVWGVFQISNQYAGAFLRGSASESNCGVINSDNGAIEFAIFEEGKKKYQMLF